MSITLYSSPRSGHCHTVRSLMSILDVEHELIDVQSAAGATRTEDFAKINPFGQIPALDDDGFVVRDSHAILFYLARKFDSTDQWAPRDLGSATRVQEWLATSTLDLVIGCAWARAGIRFKRNVDVEASQGRAVRLLGIVDAHLADREWLAVDHATIADLSMYSYIRLAPEGDVAIDAYTNIERWMRRLEAIENNVALEVTA